MFDTLIDPADNGGVGIAFTDRQGGVSIAAQASLNLGRSDVDQYSHLRTNMARVRAVTGIGPVAALHQVHGVAVHNADEDGRDWLDDAWVGDRVPGAPALPVADAAFTTRRGLALLVRVADCLPVLLADPGAGVVAAAHAGRRGLLEGVLVQTVAAMRCAGARDLQAWLGPHICGRCYEVPVQMAADAAAVLPATRATTSWGTPAVDLGAGAEAQLVDLGVRVTRHDPCTLTGQNLFSHRGDGAQTGRQVGLVWLAE